MAKVGNTVKTLSNTTSYFCILSESFLEKEEKGTYFPPHAKLFLKTCK